MVTFCRSPDNVSDEWRGAGRARHSGWSSLAWPAVKGHRLGIKRPGSSRRVWKGASGADSSLQLSSLTQAHQEALSCLNNKAESLEKSLSSLETRRAAEAGELSSTQKEAELLRKQLR